MPKPSHNLWSIQHGMISVTQMKSYTITQTTEILYLSEISLNKILNINSIVAYKFLNIPNDR